MKSCPTCQRTYAEDIGYCPHDATRLVASASATEAQLSAGLARRFRIVRRLGAGGMGTVFLAEQIAVGNRPVALKVLNRRLLDQPEFLMRFQNEAASTGRIQHPNVVVIHESGQADDGTPYIAMEFLEGQPLREVLTERGALPAAECAEILQQTSRGLNAAHKLGIVHRDLKPDNIFLTHGDEDQLIVKVVDFGIAKLREAATHTMTGMVLGTPAYMSSEQASGMRSDELDARSDVYSLGIVAYEMLTGRVPFHSDTPLGYVRKHMMENPPPFRAVSPAVSVPASVEQVVMTALTKEREQRYATALDFSRAFGSAVSAASRDLPPTHKVIEPEATPRAGGGYAAQNAGQGKVSSAVETPPAALQMPSPHLPEPYTAKPASAAPILRPPQFGTKPESSGKVQYIITAILVLVLIAVALWYFFQSARRGGDLPDLTKPVRSVVPSPSAPAGMVYIPGGTFLMGRDNAEDPEETPAHSVTVTPFFLDKEPITQAQYSRFLQKAKGESPGYSEGQAAWPATNVSEEEAMAYCGTFVPAGRLPSEAEWEFAARGNDGRIYPWGNDFRSVLVNSSEAGLGRLESVRSHPHAASPFGVLDMVGNVWEWCLDDYQPYPGHNSSFAVPADAKVIRGGSFKSDKDHVTTTTRNLDHAATRSPTIGFRCAKSP